MHEPWTPEELAWAKHCAGAGDSFAEIAAWSDRTVKDIAGALNVARPMTAVELRVAALRAQGESGARIAAHFGYKQAWAYRVLRRLRSLGYDCPWVSTVKAPPAVVEHLLKTGATPRQIADRLGCTRNLVGVVIYNLRHPVLRG